MCQIIVPGNGSGEVQAEAVSFDRWGAVVRLRKVDVPGHLVSAQDSVLLDVALPPSRAYGRRAIHCIGMATHVSATAEGALWLVLRFSQINIRQVEPMTRPTPRVSTGATAGDEANSEDKAGAEDSGS